MNYSYKDLGLVNTAEMFRKAYEGGYTVPAFNFISIEQLNAIMDAVIEKNSPVILLASPNLHRQLGHEMIARIVQSGVDRITHESYSPEWTGSPTKVLRFRLPCIWTTE